MRWKPFSALIGRRTGKDVVGVGDSEPGFVVRVIDDTHVGITQPGKEQEEVEALLFPEQALQKWRGVVPCDNPHCRRSEAAETVAGA